MNERWDDLVEWVAELADQFACGAAGEPVVYAMHGPTDFAKEVVDLVTEHRDAEIRKDILEAAKERTIEMKVTIPAFPRNIESDRSEELMPFVSELLDAIGLTENGAMR